MLLSMCVTLPTQLPRQADLPPPKRRETLLSMNRPALGESPWGVTASEHFKLRLTVRKFVLFQKRGRIAHQPCTAKNCCSQLQQLTFARIGLKDSKIIFDFDLTWYRLFVRESRLHLDDLVWLRFFDHSVDCSHDPAGLVDNLVIHVDQVTMWQSRVRLDFTARTSTTQLSLFQVRSIFSKPFSSKAQKEQAELSGEILEGLPIII